MDTTRASDFDTRLSRDLLDLTHNDKARAALMRTGLVRLANGEHGELLQEMATEILEDRLTIREAATSTVYGPTLFRGFTTLCLRIEELPDDQQKKLQASGERLLDKLRDRLSDEAEGR
jgi:hypothetical protein